MILGLDVSTSIIGICFLTNDGEFIKTEKLDLRKLDKSFQAKGDVIEKWFLSIDAWKINHVFIEDKLSGFGGGKTMQKTIVILAGFNALITWFSYKSCGVDPIHIHTSTIKASIAKEGLIIPPKSARKVKKIITARFVRDNVNSDFGYEETKAGNLKAGVDDQADAWVVARTGYLKFIKCRKTKS